MVKTERYLGALCARHNWSTRRRRRNGLVAIFQDKSAIPRVVPVDRSEFRLLLEHGRFGDPIQREYRWPEVWWSNEIFLFLTRSILYLQDKVLEVERPGSECCLADREVTWSPSWKYSAAMYYWSPAWGGVSINRTGFYILQQPERSLWSNRLWQWRAQWRYNIYLHEVEQAWIFLAELGSTWVDTWRQNFIQIGK